MTMNLTIVHENPKAVLYGRFFDAAEALCRISAMQPSPALACCHYGYAKPGRGANDPRQPEPGDESSARFMHPTFLT
jgi:hypothetical protein